MSFSLRSVMLVLLVSLGCMTGADQPREPVWGKQPCEHCAMLVSDREHAAQIVTIEGDRLFFDDPGCMAAWTLGHAGAARHLWVRTSDTQAWLPAQQARFEKAAHTPMGFGFIAVSAGSVTWSEVTVAVKDKLQGE